MLTFEGTNIIGNFQHIVSIHICVHVFILLMTYSGWLPFLVYYFSWVFLEGNVSAQVYFLGRLHAYVIFSILPTGDKTVEKRV
jgi:hypothetical protein